MVKNADVGHEQQPTGLRKAKFWPNISMLVALMTIWNGPDIGAVWVHLDLMVTDRVYDPHGIFGYSKNPLRSVVAVLKIVPLLNFRTTTQPERGFSFTS